MINFVYSATYTVVKQYLHIIKYWYILISLQCLFIYFGCYLVNFHAFNINECKWIDNKSEMILDVVRKKKHTNLNKSINTYY